MVSCYQTGFSPALRSHIHSPIGYLSAEQRGIREGLLLARNLGLSSVVVELDAALVVQFLNNNVDSCHPCSTLIHDAISLIREGWVKEVRHIYREGNKCADFIARRAAVVELLS